MAAFQPKSADPDNSTDRGKVERIKTSGSGDSTETTEWVDPTTTWVDPAVTTHNNDTTSVHGITDTSALATLTDLSDHTGDTADAHDASAISFTPAGSIAATTVQAAIEEVAAEAGGGGASDLDGLTDVVITSAADGDILVHDGSTFVNEAGTDHYEAAGAVAAHTGDSSDAHDASAISVADSGGNYTATDVEGVLAEIAPQLGGGGGSFTFDDSQAWLATQFWS